MKRRMLAAAILCICLSIFACGTLAYYTAENTVHNVITTGGVDVEVQEWADEDKTVPFPENGVKDVMPGTEVTKIVEVKNTGSSDAYIRMKVEKDIALTGEGVPDTELLVLDMNDTDWIAGEDGYYYYKTALKPGEVATPLFTKVAFDTGMDNMYQNSTATVDVTAYAVQADNNGDTVLEAQGWPAADTN